MDRASDHVFPGSTPGCHYQATTLGKSFTLMCLCHQFATVQGMTALCGWECNRKFGITLVMCHRPGQWTPTGSMA